MTHCVVAGGQELPRFPWVLVCVWVCLCACAHLCTKSQAVVCVAVHLKVVQQPLSQDKRREIIFLFTDIFFYSFLSSCRFDNDDSCQSVNYGAVLLVLQCVIHYYYWCIYFFLPKDLWFNKSPVLRLWYIYCSNVLFTVVYDILKISELVNLPKRASFGFGLRLVISANDSAARHHCVF